MHGFFTCSECHIEFRPSAHRGRPRVTCGATCAAARHARLARERAARGAA